MKIIDFETIRNLSISPADCVKWVETALRMKYDSCLPHKISMTIEPDVFFNTMPSYLPSCGRFGVKVVSRFPKREPALVSDILPIFKRVNTFIGSSSTDSYQIN